MNTLGNKEIMAENISFYMEKFGITRKKLSADLDISYTTLTDWIKGKTYPRIDKIEMLANYFKISKSDLVERKEPTTTLTLINDTSKQLNDDKQVEVLEFAKQKLTEQESNVVEFPQQVVDLSNTTMFAFDGKEISAEDRKVIEKVIQDRLNKQNKKNGDDIE